MIKVAYGSDDEVKISGSYWLGLKLERMKYLGPVWFGLVVKGQIWKEWEMMKVKFVCLSLPGKVCVRCGEKACGLEYR